MTARREPQLALAGKKHVPGLMLLSTDQGMLPVGAEPPVGSRLASGAGEAVVAAGPAVVGPSTGREVPAAEGPDPLFAPFSSTWRSVNSWKNRSPTGSSSMTAAMLSGVGGAGPPFSSTPVQLTTCRTASSRISCAW
jgi:hypothetical protein